MKGKILVTGGAGYIGSFIVRELKKEGFNIVILDNLSQGHRKAVSGFKLHEIDLVKNKNKLDKLFKDNKFTGVIHMASYIQMGESFKDPGKYFHNNIIGAINLLNSMQKHGVDKIVFSSSAGVYGSPKKLPIKENDPKNPENPYGESKLMIERMLQWFDKAHNLRSVSIRYFNAAGAALDGSIGEDHPNESHIIPLIMKAALEGRGFTIFGGNYKTRDGTCVRDYIHVLDLAKAHTAALRYLIKRGKTTQFNAGTGKGSSNKEIANEIKKVTGDFEVKIGPRRPGDADALYASTNKIKRELKWKPKYGLKEIIGTAYKWHKSHPNGYGDKK
ncbi:MAG: UDP-glucose 4-epimerase GalE [Patescibacteria group bacterium]